MTPFLLIENTHKNIAACEFFTKEDDQITADIIKINDKKNEVIIETNKVIESNVLVANIYYENTISELILKVKKRFDCGCKLSIEIPKKIEKQTKGTIINTLGAIKGESEIPSIKIGCESGKSITMTYSCHTLMDKRVILYAKEDSIYSNLIDCIKHEKHITLNPDNVMTDIQPKNIKRISRNFIIIETENRLNIKDIANNKLNNL